MHRSLTPKKCQRLYDLIRQVGTQENPEPVELPTTARRLRLSIARSLPVRLIDSGPAHYAALPPACPIPREQLPFHRRVIYLGTSIG